MDITEEFRVAIDSSAPNDSSVDASRGAGGGGGSTVPRGEAPLRGKSDVPSAARASFICCARACGSPGPSVLKRSGRIFWSIWHG